MAEVGTGLTATCRAPVGYVCQAGAAALVALAALALAAEAGALETVGESPEPPGTEIVRADTGPREILTRKAPVKFRYRSDRRGTRFECRLDAGPWKACGRGRYRATVGPGRHRFSVRAVGADSLTDPTPASRRWRVKRWRPGIRSASRFARSRGGRVSFSLDLGWRSWGRGQRTGAPMASTVKVMLMVAYLGRADVRSGRLGGRDRRLIGAMIRRSDNEAANLIAARTGPARMRRLARRAGMRDFRYSTTWGRSRTSAADQARFMLRIRDLLPARHRGWAMGQLARIIPGQRWGSAAVRPRGWRLFFKGGWGISDGRFNGIVDHQIVHLSRRGQRIGLAILTQGNPYGGWGHRTLREVARRLLRGLPRN